MFANMLLCELIMKRRNQVIAVMDSSVLIPKKGIIKACLFVIRKSGFHYFLSKLTEYMSFRILHALSILTGKNREKFADFWIKKNGIAQYNIKDINSEKTTSAIKRLNPDVIVSFNFNQILRENTLNLPFLFINLHPAPLPKYGGIAPHFWVLKNREKETAVTTHIIDQHIDLGAIVLQDKISIDPSDSSFGLLMRCGIQGKETLMKTIDLVETGKLKTIPQDSTKATYNSWPSSSDVKAFIKTGRKQIKLDELFRIY